jgi:hypothetical protein
MLAFRLLKLTNCNDIVNSTDRRAYFLEMIIRPISL